VPTSRRPATSHRARSRPRRGPARHLDALTALGALAAGHFAANPSRRAVDGKDFVVGEADTGKPFCDADGSGAGAAVQIALLSGAPVLSNVDIFVT
jgi:hypothetical protein